MLRLPGKTPLPAPLTALLEAGDCRKLLQVPGAEKGLYPAFLCPSLISLDGVTLTLSLDRERTDLGRGLVRGIWFDQPLVLWLCRGETVLRAHAWAYRCHIVGPVFTQMLARARREDPAGDIACAWQLLVLDGAEAAERPPDPEILPAGPPEMHLDHPLLHARGPEAADAARGPI